MNRYAQKYGPVTAVAFLGVVLSFQNCAQQYGVGSQGEQSSVARYQYYEVSVNERTTYPPLKMVFVVDNSDTMRVNQVNLAQSFGSMFEGSSNLTPYATDVVILSTAQANGTVVPANVRNTKFPLWGDPGIPLTGSYQSFLQANRGTDLSGQIAGDILGFRTQREQIGAVKKTSYLPAPVVGLSDGGNSAITHPILRKNAGESAEKIKTDFASRIGILDPNRNLGLNPQVVGNVTYGEFDSVIDKESGLCALARVLEKPDGILKGGDLVSYVIVSDENESHAGGDQCISRREEMPKGDLINAQCMVKTGVYQNTLIYQLDVPEHYRTVLSRQETVPGNCSVAFTSGLNVKYQVRNTNRTTRVNYTVQRNSQTCYAMQTNVSYYTVSQTCVERDGIRNCTPRYSSSSVTSPVSGDFSASRGLCTASALAWALPSNAVLNLAQYPFSCEANARRVSVSGTTSDCTTNTTYEAKSVVLNGDYSVGSNRCNQSTLQSVLESGVVFNDGSRPVSCDQNVTVTTTIGAAQNINLSIADVRNLGVSFSTPNDSACLSSVIQSRLSGLDLVNCTMTWNTSSTNLSFEQGQNCASLASQHCANDPNTTNACSGTATSQPGIVTRDSTITAAAPVTCDSACVGTSLCAASGSKPIKQYFQESIGRYVANTCAVKTPGVLVAASIENATVNRDEASALTCASNCATGGFCGSPAPARTIADHLAFQFDGIKGSYPPAQKKYRAGTCSMAAVEREQAQTLTHLAEGFDVRNACPANGYLIVAAGNPSAPYTNPETFENVHFVSGGSGTPKTDLTSYIRTRSAELLGEIPPVVTVFVRQPADGNGQGGSVGTIYNQLADALGGRKESVMSPNYSAALQKLSYSVKERIQRTIVVPGLNDAMKVTRVWKRSVGQTVWTEQLKSDQFSFSGGSVFLSETVPVSDRDQFRVEFTNR